MSIVVVTGASTGIGQATAMTVGSKRAHCFCWYAKPGTGWRASGDCLERGKSPNHPSCSLMSIATVAVEDAFKHIFRDAGQIDVLINNAGIGARGPIELAPIDSFRKAMETNFFRLLDASRPLLPSMREKRSGCIINISSVAGRFGMAIQGPYAVSKWALEKKIERMPRAGTEPIQRPGFDCRAWGNRNASDDHAATSPSA